MAGKRCGHVAPVVTGRLNVGATLLYCDGAAEQFVGRERNHVDSYRELACGVVDSRRVNSNVRPQACEIKTRKVG